MTGEVFTTTQITLATTDTEAMVEFYNAVFGMNLQPVDVYGTTLYRDDLSGVRFVLCPNSLAGVEAQKSRHQFTYTVTNLADTTARALTTGGTLYEQLPAEGAPTSTTLLDPDGNSIVFMQANS